MRIDDIIIRERQRKRMGDIAALAKSIDDLGLLQPVVVRPDGTLVAGQRRLAACRMLSWEDVPVYVAENLEDELRMLRAERDENTCRKALAPSEAVATVATRQAVEEKLARDRMLAGQPCAKFAQGETGKTRDKVAAALGMSGYTYEKAKAVVAAAQAEPEVYEAVLVEMDKSGNVDRAYKKVKRQNDKDRKSPDLHGQYQGMEIRQGDFREVLANIEDGSVKAILTDPPYGKEYLPLWDDLGRFAARALRPDGLLISYSGQMYLPQVLASLSQHLDWWWLCGVAHAGSGNPTPLGQPVRKVINLFKPLLIFVPQGGTGVDVVFRDLIQGAGKDKSMHNWQQPQEEAKQILSVFCSPGDLIVDPFAGSGGFGKAAQELKMRFIGAEIMNVYENQV